MIFKRKSFHTYLNTGNLKLNEDDLNDINNTFKKLIPLYHDIKTDLKKYQKSGWQIIGLENNISDKRLKKLSDPNLKLAEKVVLVLGEEVNGIDNSLHDIFDLFLEIPMQGQKESFNVSVATGIALYGIMNL